MWLLARQCEHMTSSGAEKKPFELVMVLNSQLDSKSWLKQRLKLRWSETQMFHFSGWTGGASVYVCVCVWKDAKQNSMKAASVCLHVCKRSARDYRVQLSIRIESTSKCRRLTAHHAPQSLWNDPLQSAKHTTDSCTKFLTARWQQTETGNTIGRLQVD